MSLSRRAGGPLGTYHTTGMPEPHKTLLRPGATEWERLNAEKRELLRPAADEPVESLLRRGVALSRQAARLRHALVNPGERPV